MGAARYKPYPAYKPSGVEWLGDIPEGWDIRRGKFVFDEVNDRSETGLETLLSVSEYYGVKPRSEAIDEGEFLTRAASLVGYKKCAVNDLAMNIMLAWKRGLGVSNYEGIISPAYSVFRFRELALPKFMHYLLRTDAYVDHFKSRSTGVIDSRLRMYPETFADIGILLPSLPEQTKIAAFLDYETGKIDALIAKQERLIALLEEKRQAVISHAVTKGLNPNAPLRPSGIDWLGDVPEHWGTASIKHLISKALIDCPHVTPNRRDEGVPFISAEAVSQGKINFDKKWGYISHRDHNTYSQRYKPQKGDLLVVKLGATAGRVAMVDTDQDFNIWVPLAAVRPKTELLSKLIFYALQSSQIKDAFQVLWTYGTQQTLGLGTLSNLIIALPPEDEIEQIISHIEAVLPDFDRLKEESLKSFGLLKERRTALISAAVTGKIDVRDWQPPQPVSDSDLSTEDLQEAAL